jgi:hypothetical protein
LGESGGPWGHVPKLPKSLQALDHKRTSSHLGRWPPHLMGTCKASWQRGGLGGGPRGATLGLWQLISTHYEGHTLNLWLGGHLSQTLPISPTLSQTMPSLPHCHPWGLGSARGTPWWGGSWRVTPMCSWAPSAPWCPSPFPCTPWWLEVQGAPLGGVEAGGSPPLPPSALGLQLPLGAQVPWVVWMLFGSTTCPSASQTTYHSMPAVYGYSLCLQSISLSMAKLIYLWHSLWAHDQSLVMAL